MRYLLESPDGIESKCIDVASENLQFSKFSMNYRRQPTEPLVSIITSVYDGDKYIDHFLKDITRQTIFHNCEFILINANSPGGEETFIYRAMESHKNIRYVKLGYDPGLYETWNMAIRIATGKYITNANLDDRRAPNHIEEHVKILDCNQSVSLVAAPTLVTKGENETWENNAHYNVWFADAPVFFTTNDLFRKICIDGEQQIISYNIPHAMPVWRKNLHAKYGWFDEQAWGSSADWEFWLRCALQGEVFQLLPEPLCLYLESPFSHERRFAEKNTVEQRIIDKYYLKI